MLTKRARLTKHAKRITWCLKGQSGHARAAFVFGMQRSGTNMLMDALDRNPSVECFREDDDEAFDNYRLRWQPTVHRLILRSRARVVVFKPICDSQNARRILNANPQGKAVWIYRHYNDVVNSALRNFKEHTQYLYYMLHDREKADWRVENVSADNLDLVRDWYSRGITDASARALIWYLRNCQFFQQQFDGNDRVLLIGYETVVTDPETELGAVCRHLAVDFNPRMTRGLFRSSVHKNDPPAIEPQIADLCDELYTRLERSRAQATLPADHQRVFPP
jgi:hypothetical protein